MAKSIVPLMEKKYEFTPLSQVLKQKQAKKVSFRSKQERYRIPDDEDTEGNIEETVTINVLKLVQKEIPIITKSVSQSSLLSKRRHSNKSSHSQSTCSSQC